MVIMNGCMVIMKMVMVMVIIKNILAVSPVELDFQLYLFVVSLEIQLVLVQFSFKLNADLMIANNHNVMRQFLVNNFLGDFMNRNPVQSENIGDVPSI